MKAVERLLDGQTRTLVERVGSFDVETPGGAAKAFTYTLPWDPMQHLAVVFGDIRDVVREGKRLAMGENADQRQRLRPPAARRL